MSADIKTLNARIDGLGRVVMSLAASLEMAGQLDGSRFTGNLRAEADRLTGDPHYRDEVQRVIRLLADQLDSARDARAR
jgi:hypothetical protein